MCGVAGFIGFDQSEAEHLFGRLEGKLEHRGPDNQTTWFKNNVGLYHARLSIIDLEGGNQPLHNKENNLHLVANGEIYNYVELQREWPDYLSTALTQSDCEAILQAYYKHGAKGVKKLNGMFAYVLYDEQKNKLTLCRDRIGIKPLYYAKTPKGFVFASEIKAILALLPTTPSINAFALSQFLNYQYSTGRETIFEGVFQVLPGEFLEIDTEKQTIKATQYWSVIQGLEVGKQSYAKASDNPVEVLKCFDQLLEQVMQEHIRTDVPFGLFLSGGMDSSVLLAKLSEMHSQSISTYSVGYKETRLSSEIESAEYLAKHFNTNHHSLVLGKEELFASIVRCIWATDTLMRDYACLPTLLLTEKASHDVKVIFSGEGGDEAFAGYRRYKQSFENQIKGWLKGFDGIKHTGQWQKGLGTDLLGSILASQKPRVYYEEMHKQLPKGLSRMQRYQIMDLITALPDNLLLKADRMMMSEGLEGRVPFADHRMIEFGLSLKDDQKYLNNRGKMIVRDWARTKLPESYTNMPKKGFYVPVNEWLSGDFLERLGNKLQHSEVIKEWFNVDHIPQLIKRQKNQGNAAREIWGMMQFAVWHELYLSGNDTIPTLNENPLDWIS